MKWNLRAIKDTSDFGVSQIETKSSMKLKLTSPSMKTETLRVLNK